MEKKIKSNSLMSNCGNFNLSDSFGSTLMVPSAMNANETQPTKSDPITFIPLQNPLESGLFLLESKTDESFSEKDNGTIAEISLINSNVPRESYHSYQNTNETSLAYHWFYLLAQEKQEHWKPFSMIDSINLEAAYVKRDNLVVATDGGRYDVDIEKRTKSAVYWDEIPSKVRRCSWFSRSNIGECNWIPYPESVSDLLESEYNRAVLTNTWGVKVFLDSQQYVLMHSKDDFVHLPGTNIASFGQLDEWGQVQPQDPNTKTSVVHRGLEGLPEIPDGEEAIVDHLFFIVHGIGSFCDIKLRNITEVVGGFREMSMELLEKHFASSVLGGLINRVEFLPINWHKTLHGEDSGTDERIKPLTLKSVPKLRSFINETLLDILFYNSPVYCQTIVNTVVNEINRLYNLFRSRNPSYKGGVSFIGHSLGSLILFDILSHQDKSEIIRSTDYCLAKPPNLGTSYNEKPTIEEVFADLDITQHLESFVNLGIDMESLLMCNESDLKESGLSLGPRKKLLKYLEEIRQGDHRVTGLVQFQRCCITSDVKYTVGPAGTGQPTVIYPNLEFKVASFFALGSPIAMFLAVRGIKSLGSNFSLDSCARFYNIFHPYDPVAYRMETLLQTKYGFIRPVLIPHHMGRKRMHLELKDTVTKLMTSDLKKKFLDSISSTLNGVYSMTIGSYWQPEQQHNTDTVAQNLSSLEEEESEDLPDTKFQAKLNGVNERVDYVLQESPIESFNEYLFALASHLCYWESEDTCLMILKETYKLLNVQCDCLKPTPPYLNTQSDSSTLSFDVNRQFSNDCSLPPNILPLDGIKQPSSVSNRARRIPFPMHSSDNPAPGMDPTVSIIHDNTLPIQPPPKMGFYRHSDIK